MKRFVIACLILLFASVGVHAYTTGQWVSPTLCNVSESMLFQVENDCAWSNDAACMYVLNCVIGIGGNYATEMPFRYGCSTLTEQECWETVGAASISWTNSNWPQHAQDNEDAVNSLLAEHFGGGGGSTNNAPVAVDDPGSGGFYTTDVDTTITVSAPGVLANDTDADGDTLTSEKTSLPMHGTVSLNDDGGFTYTPHTGYVGQDSFTYTASDGLDISNKATVMFDVVDSGGGGDCETCQSDLAQCLSDKQTLINDIQAILDAAQ